MNDLSNTFGTLDPFAPQPDAASVLSPKSPAPVAPAPRARTPVETLIAPRAPVAQTPVAAAPSEDPETTFMAHARAHESSGNDQVVNNMTGATGRYQILPSTWQGIIKSHPELGLKPEDIYNGDKQDIGYRAFINDNAKILRAQGIDVTPGTLFMASFLGPGAAPKFIRAMQSDPDFPAASLFNIEARYNPTVFYHTDARGGPVYDKPRSLSEVYQLMTKNFGGPAPKFDQAADARFGVSAADSPAVGSSAGREQNLSAGASSGVPLPAGAVLDSSPPAAAASDIKEIPLPAGAVLDPPNGDSTVFTNNADGSVNFANSPKPANGPDLAIAGVDMNGEPIFADPKAQEEYFQARAGQGEGLLAGLAGDVLGPASLLPDAPTPWGSIGGSTAQKGLNAINGVGDPTMRRVGGMLGLVAPVGDMLAGVGLGAKALGEGGSLVSAMSRGARGGAFAGADIGSQASSDAPTWAGRLEDKAFPIAENIAEGSLAGVLVPGLIGGVKALVSAGRRFAAGRALKKLRADVDAETGKAISAEDRAARESTVEKFKTKAKIAAHDEELARIEKAQEQLAERRAVREAEGRGLGSTELQNLREGVVKRARERAYIAQKQAEDAGATVEQAKAYAVEQEGKVLAAKEAAEQLALEVAANPKIDKVQFGEAIEKTAREVEAKYEAVREEAAGFSDVMESAPKGAIVKSDKILAALNKIESDTADQNLKTAIAHARENLIERGTDEAGEPVVTKAISLAKADSLRKVLNAAIRSNELATAGGNAKTAAIAHHLSKVRDMVQEAASSAYEPYGKAVKAWADNSRGPLDEFMPKGGLKNVTSSQEFSGRSAMMSGRIATQVLNNTRQGSDALAMLVRENPKLLDDTKMYLYGELTKKPLTPENINSFMRDNAEVLDRLGVPRGSNLEKVRETVGGAPTPGEIAKAATAERVDPNAKEWVLFHGTNAPEFDDFDLDAAAANRKLSAKGEEGAIFFSPNADEASGYALGGVADPDKARVYAVKVNPGKTKLIDVAQLMRSNDDAFRNELREQASQYASIPTTPKDAERLGRQFDKRWNDFVKSDIENFDRVIAALRAEGHDVEGMEWRPQTSMGAASAAIAMARKEGLDTVIIRNLPESEGRDQVAILNPNVIRPAYSAVPKSAPVAKTGSGVKAPLRAEFDEISAKRKVAAQRVENEEKESDRAKEAVKETSAREKALAAVAKDRERVRETAKDRVASAEKERAKAESDVSKSAEARGREAEKRLKTAGKEAADRKTESVSELAKAKTKADRAVKAKKDYEQFQSSISSIEPREVPGAVSSAVEKLHKDGYITREQLDTFNEQIASAKKTVKNAEALRRALTFIAGAAAAAAFGWEGRQVVMHAAGRH